MLDTISIRLETTQDLLATDRASSPDPKEFKITSEEALTNVDSGSPLTEAKFVDFVVVTAVVSLTWLIKRIVDHWLKSHEQGVQINLQTNPPTVGAVANVPHGFVVLIDKEGKVTMKQAHYEKSDDLNAWLQNTLQKLGDQKNVNV